MRFISARVAPSNTYARPASVTPPASTPRAPISRSGMPSLGPIGLVHSWPFVRPGQLPMSGSRSVNGMPNSAALPAPPGSGATIVSSSARVAPLKMNT